MPRHRKKIIDVASAIVLLALIMLDALTWRDIFCATVSAGHSASILHSYSLPVAHGSSTLLVFPNSVTMLTDAGPDAGIVDDLQKVLPSGAPSYIDLAIISSPQATAYEGYQYLLAHYGVGAFVYNGRADDMHATEWTMLVNTIAAKHIPLITLGAGDRIRYGADDGIDIVAPDTTFAHSPDASDTTIIQRVVTPTSGSLLYNR